MKPRYFIPAGLALKEAYIGGLIDLLVDADELDKIFNSIGIGSFYVKIPDYIQAQILIKNELVVSVPGISDVELVIAKNEATGTSSLGGELWLNQSFQFKLSETSIALRFSRNLLIPVDSSGIASTLEDERVSFSSKMGFSIDGQGNFTFDTKKTIESSSAFQIGDSGVQVQVQSIILAFNGISQNSEGLPINFRGVIIPSASVEYKKEGSTFPKISILQAAIGTGGFWGNIQLGSVPNADAYISQASEELANQLTALFEETSQGEGNDGSSQTLAGRVYLVNILGMKAALQYFGIGFQQSIPAWGSMQGFILMPFVDKWVKLKSSIGGPNADFMLEMGGVGNEGLINLETTIFKITADSIAYELRNTINYALISGKIKLKQPEALNIPELKVNKISIGSDGSIAIDGGWVRSPEQINLNFFGFNIGIREFGLGEIEGIGNDDKDKEATKRQWLGFSGDIQLIEGLPIKGSVDGLKISWNKQSGQDVQVALRGIGVELVIPGTLKFKGEVNYDETTNLFKGQIKLFLISLKLEVDAQLMIGKTRDAQGREFGVFYIYLSATLPVALPLGATGTGLYGIKGLVGINVSPTKTNEQKWYEWYKAAPAYEVVATSKWQPQYDNFAYGAGIQLGTIYDNGTTFNLGAMLVVLIPGPVIMLEGKANVLTVRNPKTDQQKEEEGALYLLAVLDCRAGTFEFLLDVRYSLADIVSINGSLEVFFDFNNDQNWYIYLGRKDPESKRLQATVLTFLSANAYFMIDPKAIQLGSAAGIDIRKSWGPVSFVLVAKVGFDVAIFYREFQLEGRIFLVAEIALSVFGFGFRLLLEVILAGKVPNPFLIQGTARVNLGLPWPLPSIGFDMELKWEGRQEPQPVPRLLKDIGFMHHKASNYADNLLVGDVPKHEESLPETLPIVPVDCIPVLTFHKRINNLTAIGSDAPLLPAYLYDEVAGTRFRYDLQLELFEQTESGLNPVLLGINKPTQDESSVPSFTIAAGNGRAEQEGTDSNFINGSDAQEPAIMLWKYGPTPFASSYQLDTLHAQHPPCEERLFLAAELVDWKNEMLGKQYDLVFQHEGLIFQQIGRQKIVGGSGLPTHGFQIQHSNVSGFFVGIPGILEKTTISCLHVDGYADSIKIVFPEPVVDVRIIIWFYKELSDAVQFFKVDGFHKGNKTGLLTIIQPNISGIEIVSNPRQIIDSIYLKISEDISQSDLWIEEIQYYNLRNEFYRPDSIKPGTTPSLSNLDPEKLILKPNTVYKLLVTTTAYTNENQSYEHLDTAWFKTDAGPGVLKALPYQDLPVAQVKTYVKDTYPAHGAPAHYCGYDIHLTFNERYFSNLFADKPRLRIIDRNGNVLSGNKPEMNMMRMNYRLADDIRSLTWQNGVQNGSKSSSGCKNTPTKAQFLLTEVFSPGAILLPSTLYFAELVIGSKNDPIKLYDFQFTTSKYNGFVDLMKSGASSGIAVEQGWQGEYSPTEVTPIPFPANLQQPTAEVMEAGKQFKNAEWNSLNQPVKRIIRDRDSLNGPPILDLPIDDNADRNRETTILLPAPIKYASHLKSMKVLGDFKRVSQNFASTNSKSFDDINTAVEKAFEFKVINELGEESIVDLKDRPLPDKLEFISIPIQGSPLDVILLMESPEPIQFERINMNKEDTDQQAVSFVYNNDQTRAFVVVNGSLRVNLASNTLFTLVFEGQTHGETVISQGGKNSVKEKVQIKLTKNSPL